MSHFYGTVSGGRGTASRCGTKNGGMTTYCASWEGAVRCRAYVGEDGKDRVEVSLVPWRGRGKTRVLFTGLLSGEEEADE